MFQDNRFSFRWMARLLVIVLVLALPSWVLADEPMPDGDGDMPISSPSKNPLDFGEVCAGEQYQATVPVGIRRQGGDNIAF